MKTQLIRSLIIVMVILAFITPNTALAHGEPVIAVNPAVAAAGGAITVTGNEMEPGEVFSLTLESPAGSILLGEATATGEGEEGGFTVTLTIPAETASGSYTVQAATEEGETATADLTVTAPTAEASAGPATLQEPSGEPHEIDRSKSIGQLIVAGVLVALSVAAGFILLRSRG